MKRVLIMLLAALPLMMTAQTTVKDTKTVNADTATAGYEYAESFSQGLAAVKVDG